MHRSIPYLNKLKHFNNLLFACTCVA